MLEFKAAVRDPLYGLIQLTSLELSILKTLPVTRMRWIKQMGLACLVFPGANHTRFEHSLGTMFVANKLAEALQKKTGDKLFDDNMQAIRLAALLHDLGHSPFSHVTEEFFRKNPDYLPDLREDYDHEAFTQRIIRQSEEIKELCKDSGIDYKFVSKLSVGKSQTYLDSLIAGPVDADKIDYVARDSYFCGLPFGRVDLSSLEDGITLSENNHGERNVSFEEENRSAIEGLLTSKFYLTTTIHVNNRNCAAIQLLIKAIRSAYDSIFESIIQENQGDVKKLILDALHFQWVDHDLITFLEHPFQKLKFTAIAASNDRFSSLDGNALERIREFTDAQDKKPNRYVSNNLIRRVLRGVTPDVNQSYPLVSFSPSSRYSLYVFQCLSPHTNLLNRFKELLMKLDSFKRKTIYFDIVSPKKIEMNIIVKMNNGSFKYLFDLSPLMRSLLAETTERLSLTIYSYHTLKRINNETLGEYVNAFCNVARGRAVKNENYVGSDLILLLLYYIPGSERLFFEGDTRFQALFSVIYDGMLTRKQFPYKELCSLTRTFTDVCEDEGYDVFREKGYPDFFSVTLAQDLDLLSEMGMIYTRFEPVESLEEGIYRKRYERRISHYGREYIEKYLLPKYPFSERIGKKIVDLKKQASCLIRTGP